ncbi:hypothetical protein DPMN_188993 [Dreissena polymorpha]|uniref:Integrase catalytic domain-containing protein n=1 Tax=Dreissena polymorpha TaxID=45954 RepID=A0A9D4DRY3_DREPO|nr:hypothetical protein DPMN_188993 [Dreissena polymorpha]
MTMADLQTGKSRPYHPQSQGKVERQNRILRSKIRYDMMKKARTGYNWVESLEDVAAAMNRQPKEVLAYQTPFNIYFGRYVDVNESRKKASDASARCDRRVMARYWKSKACSIYQKGDKVLLKYPFGVRRVPYKEYILRGVVLKRNKAFDKYLVKYRDNENVTHSRWLSIENITSKTIEGEHRRRKWSIREFQLMEQKRQHK